MDDELPSEMESKSSSGVLRHKAPSLRYYPYATETDSVKKEDMKEEVVRLGVKLSMSIAESMYLLCDDIRTMSRFCFRLWKYTPSNRNLDCPVVDRLLRVSHYVYTKDIKPKNGVYRNHSGKSAQWELIRKSLKDFGDGVMILHRLVMVLRRKDSSFNDGLLSSAIAKCKQVLNNLEGRLSTAKDVSKANGFARESTNIFDLWKSLFDKEATHKVSRNEILFELFKPVMDAVRQSTLVVISRSEKEKEKQLLPLPMYSPDILGKDFAKEELKVEAVRLGVELSLYVVESMFLLCDDIRSMLRFCYKICRDAVRGENFHSPVLEKLSYVMYYVNSKDIKPKNGIYQNGGKRSVQWRLVRTTWEDFASGIRDLDQLVLILRGEGNYSNGRELTSSIEEAVKKIDEKLKCAKDVSEANGFARETIESNVLKLWKSVADKEPMEATETLDEINDGIISDLFSPLLDEAAAQP